MHSHGTDWLSTNHFLCTDLTPQSRCVGVARVGAPSMTVAVDTLEQLHRWELGGPLHSLVVLGETHPLEEKMLRQVANAPSRTEPSS